MPLCCCAQFCVTPERARHTLFSSPSEDIKRGGQDKKSKDAGRAYYFF